MEDSTADGSTVYTRRKVRRNRQMAFLLATSLLISALVSFWLYGQVGLLVCGLIWIAVLTWPEWKQLRFRQTL